ncbi:hypothetical protein ENBRE01_0003 [Enteropsectra breve]|nr:hypothetical protein ENBRE01_0003 [Enteropsectra breve]
MSFPKKIHVSVKKISIENSGVYRTEYSFKDERAVFKKRFDIMVCSLHEQLFGEIVLAVHKKPTSRSSSYCIGFAKIQTKCFTLEKQTVVIETPLLAAKYMSKADFYVPKPDVVGSIKLKLRMQESSAEVARPEPTQALKKFLTFFLSENKLNMYNSILALLKETQKGSFMCRMYWIFGMLSLEYYHSHLYYKATNQEESKYRQEGYGYLSKESVVKTQKYLQYSAASFADSIVVSQIKPLRSVKSPKGKRIGSILGRIGIEENEWLLDKPGDHSSLSYIAFFDGDNRLVVSIKGTTSGSEAIHDLNCEYAPFQNGFAHKGIKELAQIFVDNEWGELHRRASERRAQSVLFTGYSLGAAACILIYLTLIQHKIYDCYKLEVFAFGCPPIVSRNIAEMPFPAIKVFNFGCDIVTRLNFGSVLDLKYICISISSLYDYIMDRRAVLHKIEEIKNHLKNTNMYTKLYTPGELYHIKSFGDSKCLEFKVKRVDVLFFEELICSIQAPFDHILGRTADALEFLRSKAENDFGTSDK